MASKGFWGGWTIFAAVMLMLIGAMNVIQGVVALVEDEYYLVTKAGLLVFDFTAWGWIMVIWGIVLLAAGVALASAREWARWFAVVVAGVNAIAQLGFLKAYPIWTVLLIAFDVLVIFALTAHWAEVRAVIGGDERVPGAGTEAATGARTATEARTKAARYSGGYPE